MDRMNQARLLAGKNGWEPWHCDEKATLMFAKRKPWMYIKVRVLPRGRMDVGTNLKHPKTDEWSWVWRKCVKPDYLDKIFENPRIHSNMKYNPKDKESKQWKD